MRRYGARGTPENPKCCIAEVLTGRLFRQCGNRRGKGPNGLYCGVHSYRLERGGHVRVPGAPMPDAPGPRMETAREYEARAGREPTAATERPLLRGYAVELRWRWGWEYDFQQSQRFYVENRADVGPAIRARLPRLVDRYAFDCGRPDHPLNLRLLGVSVTPVAESEYLTVDQFQQEVERLIEQRGGELRAKKEGVS